MVLEQTGLPRIGTLWIGGQLPFLERLCITSMAAQGHDVTLYCYDDLQAPEGVTVADAAAIIPRDRIFTYKNTGSYATFADWFRLRMIAQTGRIWLDADAALLRPFAPKDPYFFVGGTHSQFGRMVNNCILRMPADSPMCRDALDYFDHPQRFLKYMAWHRAARLALRRAVTGRWDLSRFRWGVFGMGFLPDLVEAHGLWSYVHVGDPAIVEGGRHILPPTTPEVLDRVTIAHYFSSGLRGRDLAQEPPEPGSIHARVRQICGL